MNHNGSKPAYPTTWLPSSRTPLSSPAAHRITARSGQRSNSRGRASAVKANHLVADPIGPIKKFEQINLGLSFRRGFARLMVNMHQRRLESDAMGTGLAPTYSRYLSKHTASMHRTRG